MVQGMENMVYEESLRELGLCSLNKTEVTPDYSLKLPNESMSGRARFFSELHSDGTRQNGPHWNTGNYS